MKTIQRRGRQTSVHLPNGLDKIYLFVGYAVISKIGIEIATNPYIKLGYILDWWYLSRLDSFKILFLNPQFQRLVS
jgi:hypothetical protein